MQHNSKAKNGSYERAAWQWITRLLSTLCVHGAVDKLFNLVYTPLNTRLTEGCILNDQQPRLCTTETHRFYFAVLIQCGIQPMRGLSTAWRILSRVIAPCCSAI